MIPGLPGLPGGGGGFGGSSSATSSVDAGPISIGPFNFQPAGKTSMVGLVAVAVVSVLAVAVLVRGKRGEK